MNMDQTYSRKEIQSILKKASEIQTQKDLYGDREGLSHQELLELAKEVGIDRESMEAALEDMEVNKLTGQYNWFSGTSSIQSITSVDAEFDTEHWEEVVQEIRKVTGGIGKITQNNSSYEWEQRRSDIGYKHLTLTPKNGKTRLQMVSSWNALRTMAGFMGSFIGAILILVIFKEAFSKQIGLMFAPAGGFAGFLLSRVFLKAYYVKQKQQVSRLIQGLSKKIKSLNKHTLDIEEKDIYEHNIQISSPEKARS